MESTGLFTDHFKIAAGLGRGLDEFVQTYGISLAPIAQSLGLDPLEFKTFEHYISLDRFCRLLEILATLSGDDSFGLKYALNYKPGSSGAFGYGLMNAPTFREAVEFFARYNGINVDIAISNLVIDETHVHYEWTYSPLIVRRDQYTDFATVVILKQFARLVSPNWLPQEVSLERPAPKSRALHRKYISKNLTFDAPINSVTTTRAYLDYEDSSADRELFEYMTAQCEAILAERRMDSDFLFRVRDEILASLESGNISVGRTAGRLGYSERTFQRELARYGKTFQDLVDETRRELSDRLLVESDLSLSQISFRLGFSAPSTYTRAAARWYGVSPSQYRQANRSNPND